MATNFYPLFSYEASGRVGVDIRNWFAGNQKESVLEILQNQTKKAGTQQQTSSAFDWLVLVLPSTCHRLVSTFTATSTL
jgi:hypothetical protein